jgi:hypothetical protein
MWTEQQINAMSRTELVAAVGEARSCLAEQAELEKRVAAAQRAVANVEKTAEERGQGLGTGTSLLISVVIAAVVLLIISCGLGGSAAAIFAGLIPAFVFFGVSYYQLGIKGAERSQQEGKAYYEEHYPKAVKAKEEAEASLAALRSSERFKNAALLLPPVYFQPDWAARVQAVLENRRANTLPEAFNCVEEDLHRRAMEQMQAQQTYAAQRTAQSAEETASAARDAAHAANRSAYYNATRY